MKPMFDAFYMNDDLTRFEVIDHRGSPETNEGFGRRLVIWKKTPITVAVSVQDDGRTVKIFINDAPSL